MKTVQRGNKQLRVADDQLNNMLAAGYVEIDGETGKPVAAPAKEVDELAALKKENAALRKENKALKAQVAKQTETVE